MNKTKDQRLQECKYCVNNHCQHPYYNDCDCVLWRCNLFTPKTETITQKEIEKTAEEYVLTRQQARHNAKREERVWDAFDMEQAYEDGVNFTLGKQEKDAEGEDKLLGVSRKQIDALQCEIFKAIMDAHDADDWQDAAHYILDVMPRSFAALFGSQCLPDETKNGAKDSAKEPKPAEPKEDKHFDNILKEGFRGHNRLHIAAQIVAAIYANYQAAKGFKSIEEIMHKALDIADTLLKESEKGSEA